MNTKHLIEYFNNILPLNDEEKAFVEDTFKERRVKRKEFILEEGQLCKHNTFVLSGFFRTFTIDEAGKERNLQFATENWWIGDIYSFDRQVPTNLYIKAVENSEILQIHKNDLLDLFENYPKFDKIFRILAQNAMVSLHQRITESITHSVEHRYLNFLQQHPNLKNRVSNVQIASYLGVTPEFLSAIRKRVAQK